MSDDIFEKVIQIGVVAVTDCLRQILVKLKNKKKRKWVRQWIAVRHVYGASTTLIKELSNEDPNAYKNLLRMSTDKFEELAMLVEPLIQRQNTKMRNALPARSKLELILRYLASGDSLKSLEYLFRIPQCSISKFLPSVLAAILEALKSHLKVPKGKEWENIANAFMSQWNFPRCFGAIDGKHIRMKRPARTLGEFYNYKGTYSIVLFALVDADYCFSYIDVGANGRVNDSAVYHDSTLKIAMESNALGLSTDAVIVGDDAFPLRPNLMKPYNKPHLTIKERIFNYRLSRARRVSENAFGILASRFRIFLKPIELKTSTVDLLVQTCCALHNWLRRTSPRQYLPRNSVDMEDLNTGDIIPGAWRQETEGLQSVGRVGSNNYKQEAERIRNNYANYFMEEGCLPWQRKSIGLDE